VAEGYPPARRDDIVDTLHGHAVADPYRWLEDAGDPGTKAWLDDQESAWEAYLARPEAAARRAGFRADLDRVVPGRVSPPAFRGDRAVFTRRLPSMDHAQLIVRDGDGTERVVLDPATLSTDGTITLEGVTVSNEGNRIAVVLGDAGREEVVLQILDADSGDWIERDVLLGRGGDARWLPGGDELITVKVIPGTPDDERQFHRRVYRHRVGTSPDVDDVMLFGEGRDKSTYYDVEVDQTGRWLLVGCYVGTARRNDLYLCDLDATTLDFVAVLEGVDAEVNGEVDAAAGRLVLFTDLDAPRGRLVTAPLDDPGPERWRTLVAEREDAVLLTSLLTESHLVARWERDAISRLTVHDLTTGAEQSTITLPGLGSADMVSRWDRRGDEVWIGYTDEVTPYRVLHHDIERAETAVWADAPGATPPQDVIAALVFVTSADGTRVPMRVLSPANAPRDGTGAALLTGYGGFQISETPVYTSFARLWVEAGGVFATACLRGGGEYGQAWHRDGMRANKHHVYEDFEACADWLVDTGLAARDRLAIEGGSNGGLLMGAALTRRPDAYRAVVCVNGLLDMIRYELVGLGITWNDEYGSVEKADELEWLLSYSPYHHVEAATRYPAVLVIASDEDTRVDPMHSRKMVAALQAATTARPDERPVLLRRESKVGHGARAISRALDELADELAFLADQVAL
jgi:prolyl oligopeptidase